MPVYNANLNYHGMIMKPPDISGDWDGLYQFTVKLLILSFERAKADRFDTNQGLEARAPDE